MDDRWRDLRKMFETDFWADMSDDEGIGSDESLEQVSNSSSNEGETKKKMRDAESSTTRTKHQGNKIKRSRSVLAINQLRSKISRQISRRFHDDTESVSSGISRIDVFGLPLTELCIKTGSKLPEIVTFCIDYIEKIGIIDGIYRISGQAAMVESMKNLFEQGKVPTTITEKEVHSLASVLKLFFRSLPDPLLTYTLYDRMMEISRLPAPEHALLLSEAVQHLPYHHLQTLKYLVSHLHHLARHHATTGMTSRNLAIVWAPNLIRPPCRDTNWADCGQQATVIESLIVNFSEVFSSEISPVNEVSIDDAIEEVESKAIKRTTSYCDIDAKSIRPFASHTALKRCKSDSRNINFVKENHTHLESIDLSKWFQCEDNDEDSFFESLCDRHKKMVGRPEQQMEYESLSRSLNKKLIKNIGKLRSSKTRLRGVLSRVLSFRNGYYQVNVDTDKCLEKQLQPSESNNSVVGEERLEYHYFQDVERVLKQFEFLEDELDCSTQIHQKRKNADVVLSSSVKLGVSPDSSHQEVEGFNNLEALQKLQNSVKEVNQLFSEVPRTDNVHSVNSGIFYAEVVIAR